MRTSDFDYDLPPELIAQHPAARRDEARMLVVHRETGRLDHRQVRDLPEFLAAGDVVVANNTRVIPARVFGAKAATGGKVEFLLLEEIQPGIWDVLMRARKRPPVGATILLGKGDAEAVLLDDREKGRALIRIASDRPWLEVLDEIGEPPLPPYIARRETTPEQDSEDRERYQTVFAREPGAVAAPTAGLHFTHDLLERLAAKGVERADVTLHVGIGTFRPVDVEDVLEHRMEEERFSVSEDTAEAIARARARNGRIVAVGTTTVRTLETVAASNGRVVASQGRTNLFIYPRYHFHVVDLLMTNFHLPRSTLIMMVCAFGGQDLILRAYAEAVRERYRFYSYGDCMLVL